MPTKHILRSDSQTLSKSIKRWLFNTLSHLDAFIDTYSKPYLPNDFLALPRHKSSGRLSI